MAIPRTGGGAAPKRRGAAAAPVMLRKGSKDGGWRRPSNAKAAGGSGKASPGSLSNVSIRGGGKGGN